ncbi:MAG: elongation factor Ts [Candidatus Pacebacteria bacterium]|jgi:elongation factor Ts|nr:elongation factor Ts [Candidatus Paceibacterota bacterium]|tara:strand:- start:3189 stop:3644 length:456 start_codon:yes stop_codon:yes gene_type:complete
MVTTQQIKELRERTGISIIQCKKALEEAQGDSQKAVALLQKRSGIVASKKAGRQLKAGTVAAYIHNSGDVGAMVALSSETDFVSKNKEFVALAYEIAMQVAASEPEDKDELLGQEFIKDPERTVKDLIESAIQKFGEKIEVTDFARFSLRG